MNNKLINKHSLLTLITSLCLVFTVACGDAKKQQDELHDDVNYEMTENQEHNAHGEHMTDEDDHMKEGDEHMMDAEDMHRDSTEIDHPMH